jgi:formamidopyrimidine-DNA glycosylase
MPEMPELEVIRERLSPLLTGREVRQVEVSPRHGFMLRVTPDDLTGALTGRPLEAMWRRGKFLVLDSGGQHLVINPMLGGRLQWVAAKGERIAAATVFRLLLDGDEELRFLDTVRMGRVYLAPAGGLDAVPGWSELGPEAVDISAADFATRIRRHRGELKSVLRNQAFIAGIGNAYSDEILHDAGMLPLRKRTTLDAAGVETLHASTQRVLTDAVATIAAQPHWLAHKQDRSFMRVHGKGGEACPRCGHRISELTAQQRVTSFCRGCQT